MTDVPYLKIYRNGIDTVLGGFFDLHKGHYKDMVNQM